jgi:hypothetical protein
VGRIADKQLLNDANHSLPNTHTTIFEHLEHQIEMRSLRKLLPSKDRRTQQPQSLTTNGNALVAKTRLERFEHIAVSH